MPRTIASVCVMAGFASIITCASTRFTLKETVVCPAAAVVFPFPFDETTADLSLYVLSPTLDLGSDSSGESSSSSSSTDPSFANAELAKDCKAER